MLLGGRPRRPSYLRVHAVLCCAVLCCAVPCCAVQGQVQFLSLQFCDSKYFGMSFSSPSSTKICAGGCAAGRDIHAC